ncbi:hypothetical protein I551_7891 [Mycobacterium ulcerans str. Harvey]|uniref:Uncharacterized protein n=1 Tax=Mycobacterium ulcerans str. Harvey TaxID=1299332 RepID=A0ABN0QLW1_MYCUL|nr:hypothetical protein I551_7891 [Mycobacterium ulcerans str. Harvey]
MCSDTVAAVGSSPQVGVVTAASNMTVVTMPGGHSTASRRQWPGGGPLLGQATFRRYDG